MNATFPDLRRAVISELIKLISDKYVFPDIAEKMTKHIQTKFDQGGYDHINDAGELAMELTSDLRALSNDRHWYVMYHSQQEASYIDPEKEDDEDRMARWMEQSRRNNFGFEKAEHLRGNIGYIDLRQFAPSEHAGDKAIAAMNFVAHCDALIFDLRQTPGGYPSMVQLIISYLVDPEPKLINTMYYRPTDNYQQFWTFPHVPGKRMPDIPVYVLTSNFTGSAAEEFVYDLKNMKRATIIGETTNGSAHPVTLEIVQECFQVLVPYGRPINPITKSNWEVTGVEPHISVSQEEALKIAHIHALEQLIEKYKEDQYKYDLEWDLKIVKSLYAPVLLDEEMLLRYVGQYDKRKFAIEDGVLTYMHQDNPPAWKLVPISEKRFRLEDDLVFEFILNDQGEALAVEITYRDGRPRLTVSKTN